MYTYVVYIQYETGLSLLLAKVLDKELNIQFKLKLNSN